MSNQFEPNTKYQAILNNKSQKLGYGLTSNGVSIHCAVTPDRIGERCDELLVQLIIRDEMDADVFHRFIVSLGTRRATWRRSQGCN